MAGIAAFVLAVSALPVAGQSDAAEGLPVASPGVRAGSVSPLLGPAAPALFSDSSAPGSGDRVGAGIHFLVQEEEVSPRGAFLRSLVVPGWGHAAAGAHVRGGFYFLAQATSGWMMYKSATTRASARRHRGMHLDLARSRVRATGVMDPDSVDLLARQDSSYEEFDELVETRSDQVEDWAALGIFLLLMGAADAFVSAHLQDFPEPLDIRLVPAWSHGSTPVPGVAVGFSLPWPRLRE